MGLGQRPAATPAPRNYGLDLCRALAILLVVASHILERVFGPPAAFPKLYLLTGFIGVELFFSLSGFLIGGILIDLAERGFSSGSLSTFYLRRWLRTLPAYYLVLAGLCLIYRRFDLPSFLFLQHFIEGPDLLPASWSLTMEEYFYLFFPLLILGLQRTGRKWPRGLTSVEIAALALIVIMPLLRFLAILLRLPFADLTFHTDPVMRFDCCAYGVLAACLQRRYSDRLRRAFQSWNAATAFCLALAVVAAWMGLFEFMRDYRHFAALPLAYYWGTLYFTLQSALIGAPAAFAVLYARHRPDPPNRLLDAPVRGLSRISYSLYLINGNLMSLLMAYTPLASSKPWTAVMLPLAMLLAACLSYRLVEKPVLVLRDRFIRDEPRKKALAATSIY